MLRHIGAGGMVLAVPLAVLPWAGSAAAMLLAAATALWFGFDHLMPYLFYASLLRRADAVVARLPHPALPQYLAAQQWVLRLHDKKSGVPYGIALAAAALLVYPDTPWMKAVPA